jgi:hypothetical protein
MFETNRADRNDTVSLPGMEPRGLCIEDGETGLLKGLSYIESETGKKMVSNMDRQVLSS